MRIKVEPCFDGRSTYFRLTARDGRHFRVNGARWNRAVASEALGLIECELGAARKSVRFIHH